MASVTGNRNPQIMGQGGPGPQAVNNPMMQQQIQQQQQHPQQMPNMMQQSRMPMVIVAFVVLYRILFNKSMF